MGVAAKEIFFKTIGANIDMFLEELRLSEVFLVIDGMLTEVRQVKPVAFLGEKLSTVENNEVDDEQAIVNLKLYKERLFLFLHSKLSYQNKK